MENIARDHRLALTEPPGYDIFFDNHGGSVKKPTRQPLQIWSHKKTFEDFLMMDTTSKPLALELEARSATKTADEGLEVSITVFVPRNASLEIKTSQRASDPVPLARSAKGLRNTGELRVTLPIKTPTGTVYMLPAIIGRTAVFGIIFNKEGTYIPELEDHAITAKDLFENGLFSGRLRRKYKEMGLLYMEADSALLPELERHEKKKQGPRRKKRPRDEGEVIVLSSDDDEQGCPARGSDQGHQKLRSVKASAVNHSISPSPEVRALTIPRVSNFDAIPNRHIRMLRQAITFPRRSGLSPCLVTRQPLQRNLLPNRLLPRENRPRYGIPIHSRTLSRIPNRGKRSSTAIRSRQQWILPIYLDWRSVYLSYKPTISLELSRRRSGFCRKSRKYLIITSSQKLCWSLANLCWNLGRTVQIVKIVNQDGYKRKEWAMARQMMTDLLPPKIQVRMSMISCML
jgi:hypothetical protein